jgi:hypothetical protein
VLRCAELPYICCAGALCCAVLRCATLCYAVLRCATLCYAVLRCCAAETQVGEVGLARYCTQAAKTPISRKANSRNGRGRGRQTADGLTYFCISYSPLRPKRAKIESTSYFGTPYLFQRRILLLRTLQRHGLGLLYTLLCTSYFGSKQKIYYILLLYFAAGRLEAGAERSEIHRSSTVC